MLRVFAAATESAMTAVCIGKKACSLREPEDGAGPALLDMEPVVGACFRPQPFKRPPTMCQQVHRLFCEAQRRGAGRVLPTAHSKGCQSGCVLPT